MADKRDKLLKQGFSDAEVQQYEKAIRGSQKPDPTFDQTGAPRGPAEEFEYVQGPGGIITKQRKR